MTDSQITYKPRKSTEFNGMELLVAILCAFKEVNTMSNVLDILRDKDNLKTRIIFNSEEEIDEYTKDLLSKQSILPQYPENFRKEAPSKIDLDKVTKVLISGKNNTHPQIISLNANIKDKKRNAKADVYRTHGHGLVIGLSVKQSRKDTKSNASVEKMLEEGNILTQKRIEWGKEVGF